MERINTKKVKKYIAVGSLVAIAATGLSLNHKYNPPVEYEVNEETNEFDIKGEISFHKLSNYQVITVQDLNGEYKYYIGKYNDFTHELTDLLTGEKYDVPYSIKENISAQDDVYFISSEDIDAYLITLDMVKAKYTNEDIEELYSNIINYKNTKEKEKTLTK